MGPVSITDLKDLIQDSFQVEYTATSNKARLEFTDDDTGEVQTLEVVLCLETEHKDKMGWHIHNLDSDAELEYKLEDAIHGCLRDQFGTLYVHVKEIEE